MTLALAAGCSSDEPLKKFYNSLYLNEGNYFFKNGEYDRAIDRYSKAIELDPSGSWSFTSYYYRAFSYYYKGSYASAIRDFTTVIELSPKYDTPYIARGNCYALKGLEREALSDFNDAISINPNNPYAFYNRANILRTMKLSDQAIRNYTKAITLHLDFFEDAYLRRAQEYLTAGETDSAVEDFERVIIYNPSNRSAYVGRRDAYTRMGRLKTAREHDPLIDKLTVSQARDYWETANYLLRTGDRDGALEYYGKALDLDPKGRAANGVAGGIQVSLGNLYFHEKDYRKALEEYRAALAVNPKHSMALANAGSCYGQLNQPVPAERYLKESLAVDPANDTALYNLAALYSRMERNRQAVFYFSRFIRLNPELPGGYIARGNEYETLKEHRKALEDFDRAIELDPRSATAFFLRGNTFESLEQYADAAESYTQSLKISTRDPNYYIRRANAYRLSGQYRAAIRDYELLLRNIRAGDSPEFEKYLKDSIEECRAGLTGGGTNKTGSNR